MLGTNPRKYHARELEFSTICEKFLSYNMWYWNERPHTNKLLFILEASFHENCSRCAPIKAYLKKKSSGGLCPCTCTHQTFSNFPETVCGTRIAIHLKKIWFYNSDKIPGCVFMKPHPKKSWINWRKLGHVVSAHGKCMNACTVHVTFYLWMKEQLLDMLRQFFNYNYNRHLRS